MLSRMKEPSTYAALAALFLTEANATGMLQALMDPEAHNLLFNGLGALAGAMAVFMREKGDGAPKG